MNEKQKPRTSLIKCLIHAGWEGLIPGSLNLGQKLDAGLQRSENRFVIRLLHLRTAAASGIRAGFAGRLGHNDFATALAI